MKGGLKAMKQEYKKLDINKIDALQDEMEDMLEMNSEIQDALSRQYDTPDVSLSWPNGKIKRIILTVTEKMKLESY